MLAGACAVTAQDTAPNARGVADHSAPQSSSFARDGINGEIGRECGRTFRFVRSRNTSLRRSWHEDSASQHDGVDVTGVAAVGKNPAAVVRAPSPSSGGYCIRTSFNDGDHGTAGISRKLHEQAAAREMERHYTKEKILEAYINQINLGRGWYGVDAGSRHYFGHPAAQLTIAEAATLAALPKSQPTYDPIAHPERARDRRNLILQMMADQGYITQAQAIQTKAEPMVTAPNLGMSAASGYFVDAVRQQAERAGISVINGGYRVYTTLDPALQREAVTAVIDGTNRIGSRYGICAGAAERTRQLSQAMASRRSTTGDARWWRKKLSGTIRRAVSAKRQPGSSSRRLSTQRRSRQRRDEYDHSDTALTIQRTA